MKFEMFEGGDTFFANTPVDPHPFVDLYGQFTSYILIWPKERNKVVSKCELKLELKSTMALWRNGNVALDLPLRPFRVVKPGARAVPSALARALNRFQWPSGSCGPGMASASGRPM